MNTAHHPQRGHRAHRQQSRSSAGTRDRTLLGMSPQTRVIRQRIGEGWRAGETYSYGTHAGHDRFPEGVPQAHRHLPIDPLWTVSDGGVRWWPLISIMRPVLDP